MGKLNIDAGPFTRNSLTIVFGKSFWSTAIGRKDVATICVAGRETCSYLKNHPSKYRAYVVAADTTFMNIHQFQRVFDRAAELIRDQLSQGRYVVVHCYAGINRSVTSILRYMQLYTNKDWKLGRDYIRQKNKTKRQTLALNNPTFEHFLLRTRHPNRMNL